MLGDQPGPNPSGSTLSPDHAEPLSSPSEQRKLDSGARKARLQQRTEWWDTLSKVWLTRRALRELDRRNRISRRRRADRRTSSPSNVDKRGIRKSRNRPADNQTEKQKLSNDVKRFARQGGPSLSELRNFPMPSKSSSASRGSRRPSSRRRKQPAASASAADPTSQTSGGTSRSSAYDRDFEQKLIDNKIFPVEYEHPDGAEHVPVNFEAIQTELARPRASLSPSRFGVVEFREFRRRAAQAQDEKDVERNVLPTILGSSDRHHLSGANVRFGHLSELAEGLFKAAKPDLYYGSRPSQLDQPVRDALKSEIIPSTDLSRPIAPNMFVELKGPNGTTAVAKNQVCYDGALGTRAMQRLQSYGQAEPVYDDVARTLSATYHSGHLNIYAHHTTRPESFGQTTEYQMTQVAGWSMTGSVDGFRSGATTFRNARDWSAVQRTKLIEEANARARLQPPSSSSPDSFDPQATVSAVTAETTLDSDTSADELAANSTLYMPAKRSKRDAGSRRHDWPNSRHVAASPLVEPANRRPGRPNNAREQNLEPPRRTSRQREGAPVDPERFF